jgi:hypothetical protein
METDFDLSGFPHEAFVSGSGLHSEEVYADLGRRPASPTEFTMDDRKQQDSTSLFTLCSTKVSEIRVITQHKSDHHEERLVQVCAAVHSTTTDLVVQANITIRSAGVREVEGENIPVWELKVDYADSHECYIVSTNQSIIKLMSTIRPGDDTNQTNQRLRRKWQSQRMFRVSAQDARLLVNIFPDMAYMKFRAGLVLIEWPASQEILGYLTADKQARPRRITTTTSKSKAQLLADLKRLERENEHLRTQIGTLHTVIGSLLQYSQPQQPVLSVQQQLMQLIPSQQHTLPQSQPLQSTSLLLPSPSELLRTAADSAAALALAALQSNTISRPSQQQAPLQSQSFMPVSSSKVLEYPRDLGRL